MNKKDSNTGPVTFPEKWAKVIKDLPEFKDIADAAGPEELRKIIVECESNIYTIDKEKAADVKLSSAREMAREYMQPYQEAAKIQTAKIKYALFLLEGKGVNLDNREE